MESKTILYNINSVPDNMSVEDVLETYYATGVLIYEGNIPTVVDVDNLNHDIITIVNYDEWLNLN